MIHGLTYAVDGDGRLPHLGVLRKGAPKPNDKQPGRDLGERLRFAGADEDIQADWVAMFGSDLVDEVEIILPYASVDECWQAWRESYVAGGLKVRCDGRQHVLWQRDDGTYSTDPQPCPGETCDAKAVGRLEVIVPAFERLGVITVTTTSLNDIRALDGAIRALAVRFVTRGGLAGIPMTLTRIMRPISTPGSGGRRKRVPAWLLHLEPSTEWVRHMYALSTRTPGGALTDRSGSAALPAPVDTATGEVIDGEVVGEVVDSGWTERIAACITVKDLSILMATEIEAIKPDAYRQNVRRLAYQRVAALIATAAPTMAHTAVKAAGKLLDSIPRDTDGWNTAMDAVIHRGDQLGSGGGERAA